MHPIRDVVCVENIEVLYVRMLTTASSNTQYAFHPIMCAVNCFWDAFHACIELDLVYACTVVSDVSWNGMVDLHRVNQLSQSNIGAAHHHRSSTSQAMIHRLGCKC